VLHCFTGNIEQAQIGIALNFYLGIGGVVTFKNSGLDIVVEQLELKHLVLETDAPYLAPVPHRGKRNESSYTLLVAEKIASLKNISVEEVASATTANALRLFKIKS
jgi:TatD DNase family protein